MTNGTSQGLFIVVAIVIFGVFVALSYTVFGTDGLSGSLEDLTTSAIEKTNERTYSHDVTEFKTDDLVAWGSGTELSILSENRIQFSASAPSYRAGVYVPQEYFKVGRTYTLSFYIEKVSGDIEGLGGHLFISDNVDVRVNGNSVERWSGGTTNPLNTDDWSRTVVYPNDNEKNFVELTFRRDRYKNPDMNDLNVYIQPNRTHNYAGNALEFDVIIEDFRITEH